MNLNWIWPCGQKTCNLYLIQWLTECLNHLSVWDCDRVTVTAFIIWLYTFLSQFKASQILIYSQCHTVKFYIKHQSRYKIISRKLFTNKGIVIHKLIQSLRSNGKRADNFSSLNGFLCISNCPTLNEIHHWIAEHLCVNS